MSRTDDRANVVFPVTAEVGDEGGSFADPTMQVATFRSTEPRRDFPMDEYEPGGYTDTMSGMYRYPTEPPASSQYTGSSNSTPWRAGLIGAAAGAAAMYGLLRRRR